MDGYALMRHLRRASGGRNARIPAIARHGPWRMRAIKQLALRAGYNVHLAKPVDMNELVRVAASLVKVRQPPAPSATLSAEPIPPRGPGHVARPRFFLRYAVDTPR